MRLTSLCGVALSLTFYGANAAAQTQPATIPTVVAQAGILSPELFGRPRFFSGETPQGWPGALTPPGVKVVGGSVIGDSAMYRMLTAVFAFPPRSNPRESMQGVLGRAGYTLHPSASVHPKGGFASTGSMSSVQQYCSDKSGMATFAIVDSVQDPLVVAVHLMEGEAGRQACSVMREFEPQDRFPLDIPALSAPRGTVSFGGGSSWSDNEGTLRSALRTTMPADSILSHYTAQLTAAGWKPDGRPAIAEGLGAQRFSVRQGSETWTAALIVVAAGDKRDVVLQLSR